MCYWHDPAVAKDAPDVKARLEELSRSGRSLEGYALHGADLRDADLSRANLSAARLFDADLRGASLLKTRLDGANLNEAHLEGANLLGASLDGARLERVRWGKQLRQEILAREAHRAGREDEAMNLYGEAEQIARYLTGENERRGHYDIGGHFYKLERVMRRMQMRLFSGEWAWSKLVDLLCGYGEDTVRVIAFSLVVILGSAVLYFLLGVRGPDGMLLLDPAAGLKENLLQFLTCVYYSVITFTTVGYGDIYPVGVSRVVAALEAFTGAFSISLFVVVFVRKMTR
ncbi:MAG: pentapeptide repeat-containing protein [Betaproteobacteria bacterium]|nr:pentapeptide repeat-containing protein [Betaproteobacteria bacterium]